jgi:hypothetical protein
MQVFSAPPRAVIGANATIAALAIRLYAPASFREKLRQLVGKFCAERRSRRRTANLVMAGT